MLSLDDATLDSPDADASSMPPLPAMPQYAPWYPIDALAGPPGSASDAEEDDASKFTLLQSPCFSTRLLSSSPYTPACHCSSRDPVSTDRAIASMLTRPADGDAERVGEMLADDEILGDRVTEALTDALGDNDPLGDRDDDALKEVVTLTDALMELLIVALTLIDSVSVIVGLTEAVSETDKLGVDVVETLVDKVALIVAVSKMLAVPETLTVALTDTDALDDADSVTLPVSLALPDALLDLLVVGEAL